MALRIMLIATLLGVLTSCGVSDTSSPLASDSTPIPLAPASIIPAEPTPVAAPTADIDCSNLLALTSEEDQGECIRRKDAQPEQTLAVMQATLDVLNLTPTVDCNDIVAFPNAADRDECVRREQVKIEQTLSAIQTTQDVLNLTPEPTATFGSVSELTDDVTATPYGYTPPSRTDIYYIGRIYDMSVFRYARSIWHAGAVSPLNDQYVASEIIVYVGGSTDAPVLLRASVDPQVGSDPEVLDQYTDSWPCPRAIGDLTIDSVTGPDGIITFSSTSGQRGTFDMATETWQFAE